MIDCTMKPPGFSPVKWWKDRSKQPKQIKLVRWDVTEILKDKQRVPDGKHTHTEQQLVITHKGHKT